SELLVEGVLLGVVLLALWRFKGFWKMCAAAGLGVVFVPLIPGEGSPRRAPGVVGLGIGEPWGLPWDQIGRWLLVTAPTVLGVVGLVLSLRGKGGMFRRLALRMNGEATGSKKHALLSRFPRVVSTLVAVREWLCARIVILIGILLLS